MAVSSTSSTTGTSSVGQIGTGNVIDVAGIITKLDAVEQAPIDRVNKSITQNNVAISDLGTIKAKMAALQTALQDLTDPLSYKNKTASVSDATVASATVTTYSSAVAGDYAVTVTALATPSVASYIDTNLLNRALYLGSTTIPAQTSLTALRDYINTNVTTVRASVVEFAAGQQGIVLSSTEGGAAATVVQLHSDAALTTAVTTRSAISVGTLASFTVNGQSFTRTTNSVDNAIPGVRLQLSKVGSSLVTVSSASSSYVQTLVTNVGQAYNDLMASYQKLAAYDADPEKRGSLYGDSTLMDVINGLANSLMTGFKKLDGTALNNSNGKPISMTTLGLELQLDGTVTFNAEMFNNAEGLGVFDQLVEGFVAPTRTSINAAIGLTGETGMIGTDLSGLEDLTSSLQTRVKDLEERKATKMAKYQAQYAALDALLYRLQSLNSSLSATFNSLNNQNNK